MTLLSSMLATGLVLPADPAEAAVRSPFVAVYSGQDNGAISLVGNSQMSCVATVNGCTSARAGTTASSNNEFTMQFQDTDVVTATSNSTSSELTMPSGSTVLYARLVWGGRLLAGTGGVAPVLSPSQVKFRAPGEAAYSTLTGTLYDPGLTTVSDSRPYQTSLDVTSRVAAAGNGTYWVGDIAAATGVDRYAGWSLIVAYRNPAAPLRDLTIFQGFADVTSATGNNSVNLSISGFLTPATGPVNASVGVVAWEGDNGIVGDGIKFNNTSLSDGAHPATNFFNSGISDAGVNQTGRSPAYSNNLGVDIARVSANGVLPNSATSATVNLNTTGDFYYPGIVTTQIDLFTPAFNPISKTVVNLNGNDPAKVGDTLEYQLNFTNTGADFADRVVIRDPLTTNLAYVPGSIAVTTSPGGTNNGVKTDASGDDIGEYDAAGRLVRVRVGTGATATAGGTLAPNNSVNIKFRATVSRPAAGTTLVNTAQLDYRARTIAKDFTFTGNPTETPVQSIADLAIVKTTDPASQNAGGPINYHLDLSNNGPTAATNVVTVDTLPAGVTYVSSNPPTGTSCTVAGQIVTCTTTTLASGAQLSIPLVARIAPGSALGNVTNTARVSSDVADDNSTNNTSSVATSVTTSAEVSLTNTAAPTTVAAGAQVTYTLTATNAGPSNAKGIIFTDAIPAGMTFVSASVPGGTCEVANSTITCTAGTLGPTQAVVATVVLQVTPDFEGTSIANPATVSSTTPDPISTNNSATATIAVNRSADVVLTKTASVNPVVAGSVETYTVAVKNNGPSDATSVVVSDPAVAGLSIRTATATAGTCTIAAGSVSCAIGRIARDATVNVTLRYDVAASRAGGPLSNVASVTSDADPTAANNSSTSTVTVVTSSDLSLTKTSSPAAIVYGAPVTYSLTATNAGPDRKTHV